MKKRKRINILTDYKRKFRLIIMNDQTLEERISIRFSALEILSIVFCSGLFLFITFILLVGYTPMNQLVPGKASRSVHKDLISLVLKADSLEKMLLENELYLNNITAIVNGEDPKNMKVIKSATDSIVDLDISFKKSIEDSLLRIAVESEDRISINTEVNKERLGLENILFFSPIKGVVTNSFNIKENHFGVDIVAKKGESIKCVYDGVVVISNWTTETGYVIGVQHANGVFSIYKHNSILFKEVGEYVSSGEVIAIIGNSGEFSSGPHLHFELWYKGISVNPENYISF